MRHKQFKIVAITTVFLIGIALFVVPLLYELEIEKPWESPTERVIARKVAHEKKVGEKLHLSLTLADPEEAPAELRELVEFGYQLMINTPKYASAYVGDSLTCANCHFAGGNTTGGKNGGISLVGVDAKYPIYDIRFHSYFDLAMRMNNCFERSMNGTPPAADSQQMKALLAYLKWISRDLPKGSIMPWLGLPSVTTGKAPNPEEGKKIYAFSCAMCHGINGAGNENVPPLWGEKSFNNGAGMNMQKMLSGFVYLNMPQGDPYLTEQQANDVAAYIIEQPRPAFRTKE